MVADKRNEITGSLQMLTAFWDIGTLIGHPWDSPAPERFGTYGTRVYRPVSMSHVRVRRGVRSGRASPLARRLVRVDLAGRMGREIPGCSAEGSQ
jgi:hypothetical protein